MKKNIWMWTVAFAAFLFTGCANPIKTGTEQLEGNQYSNAIASFGEAIEKEKNLAEAYHGQGIAYWELGEYEKAREALEKALSNGAKESANVYQTLGDCCMDAGDYDEALSYYWKGMACADVTEKQLQEMLYNEVVAYENLKDWSSAKVKMADYVSKYPEDTEAAKEAEFLETR